MTAIRWPMLLAEAEAEQFGDDLFQCDACAQMVPRDEIATVRAYGIETSACAACRGENIPAGAGNRADQPPDERKGTLSGESIAPAGVTEMRDGGSTGSVSVPTESGAASTSLGNHDCAKAAPPLAFSSADFPGFTAAQIRAGLTVPATEG